MLIIFHGWSEVECAVSFYAQYGEISISVMQPDEALPVQSDAPGVQSGADNAKDNEAIDFSNLDVYDQQLE